MANQKANKIQYVNDIDKTVWTLLLRKKSNLYF